MAPEERSREAHDRRANGLEVIDPDECRKLLASDDVGRLVVVHDGTPFVFPVNYALDEGAIVFRTAPGTKLTPGPGARWPSRSARSTSPRTGWSVVVTGRHTVRDEPRQAAEDFRAGDRPCRSSLGPAATSPAGCGWCRPG